MSTKDLLARLRLVAIILHMAALALTPLERMHVPFSDCLTAESAERVVQFQPDPETRGKIDELADKANQGTLTESEKAEYFEYVEAIDLISILQAKARGS